MSHDHVFQKSTKGRSGLHFLVQLIKRLPTIAASDLPDSLVRYTFEWLTLVLDEGGHYHLSLRESHRHRNSCLTRGFGEAHSAPLLLILQS